MKKKIILGAGIVFLISLILGGAGFFFYMETRKAMFKEFLTAINMNEAILSSPALEAEFGKIKSADLEEYNEGLDLKEGTTKSGIFAIDGEKKKGKLSLKFSKGQNGWFLSEAYYQFKGDGVWRYFLPPEIVETKFHSGSAEGPVNEKREYLNGETTFWTARVARMTNTSSYVSLQAGLKVVDTSNGELVFENLKLTEFSQPTPKFREVDFSFYIALPPGDYIITSVVQDLISGLKTEKEDKVKVLPKEAFRITEFKYSTEKGVEIENAELKVGQPIVISYSLYGFGQSNGKTNLTEDFFIYDNEGKEILQELEGIKHNEKFEDLPVIFTHKLTPPTPGDYKLKVLVHDKAKGDATSFESSFKVIP